MDLALPGPVDGLRGQLKGGEIMDALPIEGGTVREFRGSNALP